MGIRGVDGSANVAYKLTRHDVFYARDTQKIQVEKGAHFAMGYQKYQPDRYKRKSLRLKGRDYSAAGAYFVTIRTYQYERFLEIPKLRYIVLDVWKELPERYPHVTLDEFVIMPDHVHFILWLDRSRPDLPLGSVVGPFKSMTTVRWLQHLKAVC